MARIRLCKRYEAQHDGASKKAAATVARTGGCRVAVQLVTTWPSSGCHVAVRPVSTKRCHFGASPINNNLHLKAANNWWISQSYKCNMHYNSHFHISCWLKDQPTPTCSKVKQCLNLVAVRIFVLMSAELFSVGIFIIQTVPLVIKIMVSYLHMLGAFMVYQIFRQVNSTLTV